METQKDKKTKLYYSIGEVARQFGLNESTLRFWEKEFDIIRPRKTEKGTRYYKDEDVEAVRLVFHLVKERGMTLYGAKRKLKENKEDAIRQGEIVHRLKGIRTELLSIIEALDAIQGGTSEE